MSVMQSMCYTDTSSPTLSYNKLATFDDGD